MDLRKFRKWALFIGIAVLMTHELDAVRNSEWLVLPLTSWLPPEVGYEIFLWAHVPIFTAIIAFFSSSANKAQPIISSVLAGFLVIHGMLHLLFSGHEHYHFTSFSSNALIYGGASFGLLYFALGSFEDRG